MSPPIIRRKAQHESGPKSGCHFEMKTPTKVITALALAGIAVAGGAAFTATGVDMTAPATQFLGGTVSQAVQGATLSNIAYTYVNPDHLAVQTITMTFAGAEGQGKVVTLAANGGSGTFDPVAETAENSGIYLATSTAGYTGLSSINITVADKVIAP
jgi:hypothetical protein